MTTEQVDFDDYFITGEMETCEECHGEGWVSICWDDLCHGDEGCIHGDGNVDCRACEGYGETFVPWEGAGQ